MELLLATRNAYKKREFAELLGDDFEISDLSTSAGPPIEETGDTFTENAVLKAVVASQDRQLLVAADDSGLEVNAFDGAPGIFSARYAGDNATDRANIDKLLRELEGRSERSARFCCVIALARGGKLLGTFEGLVDGIIVDPPRGENGFGYDPIFVPNGFDKTFAELPAELKNRISHRGRAIRALRAGLSALQRGDQGFAGGGGPGGGWGPGAAGPPGPAALI
jgi:XTP/dITP diphosphohydrolase